MMKRLGWILAAPALAGCFLLPSGENTKVVDVNPDLKRPRLAVPPVPDRHPYGDPAKLRVGQWATYREGPRTLTLAAVAEAPEAIWIEVIEEGEPRQVSARRVRRDGVVEKAYYAEISGQTKSSVEGQELQQSSPPSDARRTEAGRETGEETVTVGGRTLKATAVRVRYEDLLGRITEETALWHKDVPPIYAGSEFGGLVRRQSAEGTVELVDFGEGAKPLLEIPP